jgi:hypothetical protein
MKPLLICCAVAALAMTACGNKPSEEKNKLREEKAVALLNEFEINTFLNGNPASESRGWRKLVDVVTLDLRGGYGAAIIGDRNPPTEQIALVLLLPAGPLGKEWSVDEAAMFTIDERRTLHANGTHFSLSLVSGRPRKLPSGADAEIQRWWDTYLATEKIECPEAQRKLVATFLKDRQ